MKAKLAILGMLALSALVACQRQEKFPDNPTYDPIAGTVNAKFVLNVSTNSGPDTKMTAANVQDNGQPFRGMSGAHVLAYNITYGNDETGRYLYKVDDPSSVATRDFDLGDILTPGEISESNHSRMVELSLPLNTNALLFYALAKKTKTDDEQGAIVADGTAFNSTLEDLYFELKSRLPAENMDAFQQCGILHAGLLTALVQTGLVKENAYMSGHPADKRYAFWWPYLATLPAEMATRNTDGSPKYSEGAKKTYEGVEYTFHTGEMTWQQMGAQYDRNHDGDATHYVTQDALTEILGEVYSRLTDVVDEGTGANRKIELRAGSSAAVLRQVRDISAIVEKVRAATPTGVSECIALAMADEIHNRIDYYFEGTGQDLKYRPYDKILENLKYYSPETSTMREFPAINTDAFFAEMVGANLTRNGFPLNMGLPAGAANIRFAKTETTAHMSDGKTYVFPAGCFYFVDTVPAYGMGGDSEANAFPVKNYRYPAELLYFGNSPLRVSNDIHEATDFPGTTDAWDTDGTWEEEKLKGSGWTKNGSVLSSTRSIALVKQVNYGTALLETTVEFGSSVLNDNNAARHPGTSDEDNVIDVSAKDGLFKITGLVVGGMPTRVGWDFTQYLGEKAADGSYPHSEAFDKMIYDKFDSPQSVFKYGSSSVARNYTLVWDNYDHGKAADEQSPVFVAIELRNDTGKDLWGELNMIRNGATFYLVGTLDPHPEVTTQGSNPHSGVAAMTSLARDNYFYPPFDANGQTINAPRVFMQDYKTIVHLKIGKNALKHAYVTVPDLRSSQVSMALSVDITWETGITFDVPIG